MKLLILTSRFPYPLEKGDKLRIYHQIRQLHHHHDIILCSLSDEQVSEQDYEAVKPFCKKIYIFPLSARGRISQLLKATISPLPFQVAWFYRQDIYRHIQAVIREETPDHVFCQLIRMGEYLPEEPSVCTLDYMDCFSVGMRRRAQQANPVLRPFLHWEARKVENYEKAVYQRFTHHTIISRQDRELLPLADASPVSIIPNGIDTEFFRPEIPHIPVLPEGKFDVIFVGNMGYFPNVRAAQYLVKEIMPLVWKELPDVRVLLAGARPVPSVRQLARHPNVTVSGWVEDIRSAYLSGSVFVAPLFSGSGQQNKILEAMAMGVPCITTDLVNNAIQANPGEEILIANDKQSFADQFIGLTGDKKLHATLENKGVNFVRNNFSWQNSVEKLMALWKSRDHADR